MGKMGEVEGWMDTLGDIRGTPMASSIPNSLL